jgi:hypothetical protein
MSMSKVSSRSEPELCGISVSMPRAELSETVGGIWPGVHKRAKGNGFWGNTGEDIKGMSGDNVREVRDYGNAVSGIRSLI